MNLGSPPILVIHTVPFQVCILNKRYAKTGLYSKQEPIVSGVYFKQES
jgi:hypothetical protein